MISEEAKKKIKSLTENCQDIFQTIPPEDVEYIVKVCFINGYNLGKEEVTDLF